MKKRQRHDPHITHSHSHSHHTYNIPPPPCIPSFSASTNHFDKNVDAGGGVGEQRTETEAIVYGKELSWYGGSVAVVGWLPT